MRKQGKTGFSVKKKGKAGFTRNIFLFVASVGLPGNKSLLFPSYKDLFFLFFPGTHTAHRVEHERIGCLNVSYRRYEAFELSNDICFICLCDVRDRHLSSIMNMCDVRDRHASLTCSCVLRHSHVDL